MSDDRHSKGSRAKRLPAVGNPVAKSPLLRKGGSHERSVSGQRHQARLSTYDAIEVWLEELEEEEGYEKNNGEPRLPLLYLPSSAVLLGRWLNL